MIVGQIIGEKMGILKKTTRYLVLSDEDEPEEIIINSAVEAAKEKWNKGNTSGAERDLREAKANVEKYRNRYSGTQKQTLTSTPVSFTGKTMRDADGNTCEVMLMSDGSEYGCPAYAEKDMSAEMKLYRDTQSNNTQSSDSWSWGDLVYIVLTVLMVAFIIWVNL